MSSSSSDVDIRMRLRGARETAAGTRKVKGELDGLGSSSRRVARDLSFMRSASSGVSQTLDQVGGAARRGALYVGGALTAALGYGVRAGLKFNATMEQNEVAFTQFLGSAGKAKAYLSDLYSIAAKTPFEVDGITTVSRRLLAFGFTAKETKGYLWNIADAVSAMGGGADELNRLSMILGQIKAKGKLQGDELLQLGELGINGKGILKKELKLTNDELADMQQNGELTAKKVIPALMRGLDKTFGGQSLKQAKTFNGQVSTLKDYLNQTAGAMTQPLFRKLRDDLFPGLTKSAEEVSAIFKRTDLTTDEKWKQARESLKRNVGPFAREVEHQLKAAHLDEKLGDVIEWAIPKMADAGAKAAPKVLGAFLNAFNHSGLWGKLFILSVLGKRLGVFGVLGRRAANYFGLDFGQTMPGKMEEGVLRNKGRLSGIGNMIGRTVGVATVAFFGYEVLKGFQSKLADVYGSITDDLYKAETDPGVQKWRRRARDPKRRQSAEEWYRKHPRASRWADQLLAASLDPSLSETVQQQNHLDRLRTRLKRAGFQGQYLSPGYRARQAIGAPRTAKAARLDPVRRPDELPVVVTHINIDGKEVAKAVGRATEKARNRK